MSPDKKGRVRITEETLSRIRRYIGQQYAEGKTWREVSIESFVEEAIIEKLERSANNEQN